MRRNNKFKTNLIIYLSLIAFATLISFIFDQQVIQKENVLRDLNYKINSGRVNIDKYKTLLNSLNKIELSYNYNQQIKKNIFDKIYIETDMFNQFYYDDTKVFEFDNIMSEINNENFVSIKNKYRSYMLKNFENYNEELENIGITIKQFSNDNLFSELFKEQPTNSIDNLNTYIINNYDYDNFDFNKYLTTEEVENMSPEDWENEQNYKIYSNIREKMDHHVDLAEEITHLSEIFRIQYSNIYINFFDTLDSFAEEKNKKNYFILLSIVFQILSLFFLILLFKTIVFNEK